MTEDTGKTAVQIEAEGPMQTTVITWREFTFTVPASLEDWPASASLAFEDGRYLVGIREAFDSAEFAGLMDSGPTNRDVAELFTTMCRTMGLGSAGNSRPAASPARA